MSRQIWIIFLVITNVLTSFCQISEDFSGDMLSQIWEGDRDAFIINSDHQLQLNTTEAGQTSLYTPIILKKEMAWNFSFMLDFNPSNSNKLRIYLYRSDPSSLSDDALFLDIGRDGSADGLLLYQRIDNNEELIASGTQGLFSENPEAELIITISSDNVCSVSIISPMLGCIADDILVPITSMETGTRAYFGWTCDYSSSRADKFFFDDIVVGPYEEDIMPPFLINVELEEGGFNFNFNEPILSDFTIITTPLVTLQNTSQKRSITVTGAFQENQEYAFSLQGISDLSGNLLDTSITYFISRRPQVGELLINEILFNPRGTGADYVEIINTSIDILSLSSVAISNLDKNETLPILRDEIVAGEIIVLTDDVENVVNNYPSNNAHNIIQQAIPTWNNDNGNVTILFRDEVIDEFNYDEDMHLAFLDLEDGVSLERISTDRQTLDVENWTSASTDSGFGTPGLPNSASSENNRKNEITLASKIISPNGDGDRDLLRINYNLESPGYVATASIYTDSGQLVEHVFKNQSLSTTGSFSWEPNNDKGFVASTGIYILVMELFNLNGTKFQEKLSFAIAKNVR